jgi:Rrf2 family protein
MIKYRIIDKIYQLLLLTLRIYMQITRQADYAIRAILYLASLNPTDKAATSLIAEKQEIPPSFLAKIISQLSIAGLIHTSRGAKGGVTLARDPATISLLDVVEAIDGPVSLNQCTIDPRACVQSSNCVMHSFWCEAQEELVGRLGKTNFAQFVH